MSRDDKIRVLLVDDSEFVREDFQKGIEKYSDIDLHIIQNFGDAVKVAKNLAPCIVLLDIISRTDQFDGLRVAKQLRQEEPRAKVIVHTESLQPTHIEMANCLSNVMGYIVKECVIEKAVKAARIVSRGGQKFDPEVRKAREGLAIYPNPPGEDLTPTEADICYILREKKDLSREEIAEILSIRQIKTVASHLRSIFAKFHLGGLSPGLKRSSLVDLLVREGIEPGHEDVKRKLAEWRKGRAMP